jgi:hypothetical protein
MSSVLDLEDPTENGKSKGAKPVKVLPTNRMAMQKQLDTLRAFGAASEPGRRAVTNLEVSKIIGLHQTTVGLAVPFFTDVGLLQKVADGLVPSPEVVDFTHANEWSPETAAHRLAPVIAKSWFATTLLPKLRFGSMTDDAAIHELALVAKAAPAYRGQLDSLLEYMAAAGIVSREANQIRLAKVPQTEQQVEKPSQQTPQEHSQRQATTASIGTSFSGSGAGVVQFNISVKVDMTEFAGWAPDRISAFFSGIAQVLAAKGSIEEGASKRV